MGDGDRPKRIEPSTSVSRVGCLFCSGDGHFSENYESAVRSASRSDLAARVSTQMNLSRVYGVCGSPRKPAAASIDFDVVRFVAAAALQCASILLERSTNRTEKVVIVPGRTP